MSSSSYNHFHITSSGRICKRKYESFVGLEEQQELRVAPQFHLNNVSNNICTTNVQVLKRTKVVLPRPQHPNFYMHSPQFDGFGSLDERKEAYYCAESLLNLFFIS
jgi:hypothetical protein